MYNEGQRICPMKIPRFSVPRSGAVRTEIVMENVSSTLSACPGAVWRRTLTAAVLQRHSVCWFFRNRGGNDQYPSSKGSTAKTSTVPSSVAGLQSFLGQRRKKLNQVLLPITMKCRVLEKVTPSQTAIQRVACRRSRQTYFRRRTLHSQLQWS